MRKNISILLIICFVFSLFPSPMIAGGGKKEKVEIIEWSSQSYLYVEENSAGVTKVGKGATVLQQDANSAKVMYSLTTQKSIQGKKIKEVKSIKATDLWHRDKVDSWWLDFWDAYNSRRGITGGNEITGYEVKDGVLNVSANVYVSPPYYNGQIHTRDLLDITEKYAFDYFRALGASIPDSMEEERVRLINEGKRLYAMPVFLLFTAEVVVEEVEEINLIMENVTIKYNEDREELIITGIVRNDSDEDLKDVPVVTRWNMDDRLPSKLVDIKAGETVTVEHIIKYPKPDKTTKIEVEMEVNPYKEITETTYDDNIATASLIIGSELPNLIMREVSVTYDENRGELIFTGVVENDSEEDFNNMPVVIRWNKGSNITKTVNLRAGRTAIVQHTVSFPKEEIDTTIFVEMEVNPNRTVEEVTYDDNTANDSIDIPGEINTPTAGCEIRGNGTRYTYERYECVSRDDEGRCTSRACVSYSVRLRHEVSMEFTDLEMRSNTWANNRKAQELAKKHDTPVALDLDGKPIKDDLIKKWVGHSELKQATRAGQGFEVYGKLIITATIQSEGGYSTAKFMNFLNEVEKELRVKGIGVRNNEGKTEQSAEYDSSKQSIVQHTEGRVRTYGSSNCKQVTIYTMHHYAEIPIKISNAKGTIDVKGKDPKPKVSNVPRWFTYLNEWDVYYII